MHNCLILRGGVVLGAAGPPAEDGKLRSCAQCGALETRATLGHCQVTFLHFCAQTSCRKDHWQANKQFWRDCLKAPSSTPSGIPYQVRPSHNQDGVRVAEPDVFPGDCDENDPPPARKWGFGPEYRDPKIHKWDEDNEGINRVLFDAAAIGNLPLIRQMVKEGASINAANPDDYYQWNALHRAAYRGAFAAVQLMLDLGGDVDCTDNWRKTPLHLAAELGRQTLCGMLLDRGASINALNKNNQTALHYAARDGYTSVVVMLLNRGADPNIPDIQPYGRDGMTPLDYALENSYTDTVQVLNQTTWLRSNYTEELISTGCGSRLRSFYRDDSDTSTSQKRREEEVYLSLTPSPSE